MPGYVDGFLLPVPKENIEAYRRIAQKAGEVWLEHGALEYRECVGEDLEIQGMTASFPTQLGVKPDETVVFAWIVYESREHRDSVNKKVMADERMQDMDSMPFDMQRMMMGGFEILVDL